MKRLWTQLTLGYHMVSLRSELLPHMSSYNGTRMTKRPIHHGLLQESCLLWCTHQRSTTAERRERTNSLRLSSQENIIVNYLLFQPLKVENLSRNLNGDVTGCPSFTLNSGRATHGSLTVLWQAAWPTVTLSSPHCVPSAAASSLERQEPFTEHHSVWQRF